MDVYFSEHLKYIVWIPNWHLIAYNFDFLFLSFTKVRRILHLLNLYLCVWSVRTICRTKSIFYIFFYILYMWQQDYCEMGLKYVFFSFSDFWRFVENAYNDLIFFKLYSYTKLNIFFRCRTFIIFPQRFFKI